MVTMRTAITHAFALFADPHSRDINAVLYAKIATSQLKQQAMNHDEN